MNTATKEAIHVDVVDNDAVKVDAIIVNNVYKKFGKPGAPLWKRVLKIKQNRNSSTNGNGAKNGNGNLKREIIAVNHVSFKVRSPGGDME
jgi:hypothetical protein